jgi:hypothetical protein
MSAFHWARCPIVIVSHERVAVFQSKSHRRFDVPNLFVRRRYAKRHCNRYHRSAAAIWPAANPETRAVPEPAHYPSTAEGLHAGSNQPAGTARRSIDLLRLWAYGEVYDHVPGETETESWGEA